jgi:hypothetical protein
VKLPPPNSMHVELDREGESANRAKLPPQPYDDRHVFGEVLARLSFLEYETTEHPGAGPSATRIVTSPTTAITIFHPMPATSECAARFHIFHLAKVPRWANDEGLTNPVTSKIWGRRVTVWRRTPAIDKALGRVEHARAEFELNYFDVLDEHLADGLKLLTDETFLDNLVTRGTVQQRAHEIVDAGRKQADKSLERLGIGWLARAYRDAVSTHMRALATTANKPG